jgi:hypothetical protein
VCKRRRPRRRAGVAMRADASRREKICAVCNFAQRFRQIEEMPMKCGFVRGPFI